MKQTSMCRLTPLLITGVITRQNFRVLVRQVHHLVGGSCFPGDVKPLVRMDELLQWPLPFLGSFQQTCSQ